MSDADLEAQRYHIELQQQQEQAATTVVRRRKVDLATQVTGVLPAQNVGGHTHSEADLTFDVATQVELDAETTARTNADAAHAAAADPHTGYQKESEKGVASGYASLDADTKVPIAQLPDATTTAKGIVELATSAETTAGLAVQASDTRLSNARTPTSHGSSHTSAGSDPIPIATTTTRGTVELATDGENAANVVVQGNDSRLSNSRAPTDHDHTGSGDGGDLTGALVSTYTDWTQQGSDPAAPGSGKRRLYAKSDGVYQMDSAGFISPIVDGSGSAPTGTAPLDLHYAIAYWTDVNSLGYAGALRYNPVVNRMDLQIVQMGKHVELAEQASDPPTLANYGQLYAKDKAGKAVLYWIDDSGTVYDMSAHTTDAEHGTRGGSTLHAVATTGTAGFQSAADKAKQDQITITTGKTLSLGVTVSTGTSFPGSPASGDLCLRTDLQLLFEYDGTRWRATAATPFVWSGISALSPYSAAGTAVIHGVWPDHLDAYVTYAISRYNVAATNDASNYWTIDIQAVQFGGTATTLDTFTTAGVAAASNNRRVATPNTLLDTTGSASANYIQSRVNLTKTGTPGNLTFSCTLLYRLVG